MATGACPAVDVSIITLSMLGCIGERYAGQKILRGGSQYGRVHFSRIFPRALRPQRGRQSVCATSGASETGSGSYPTGQGTLAARVFPAWRFADHSDHLAGGPRWLRVTGCGCTDYGFRRFARPASARRQSPGLIFSAHRMRKFVIC
jgi:hypothetical protein